MSEAADLQQGLPFGRTVGVSVVCRSRGDGFRHDERSCRASTRLVTVHLDMLCDTAQASFLLTSLRTTRLLAHKVQSSVLVSFFRHSAGRSFVVINITAPDSDASAVHESEI